MYYKCISLTKNKIVIQGTDGSILNFDIPDEPTGRELGDLYVFVINLKYDHVFKYRIQQVDRDYIANYAMLLEGESKRSYKTYLKAQVLNRLYIPSQNYDTEYIVFTDKNNTIRQGTHIKANTVQFTGSKDIVVSSKSDEQYAHKGFNRQTQISCDTAIIDNMKIYSKLISRYMHKELLEAKTLVIKHNFLSLDTVEEVLCIFKETVGIDTNNEFCANELVYHKYVIDSNMYTRVLPKFDFDKISLDSIINKVEDVVANDDKRYKDADSLQQYKRLVATLLFLISMWLTCYKSIRISCIISKVYKQLLKYNTKYIKSVSLRLRGNIVIDICKKEVGDVL